MMVAFGYHGTGFHGSQIQPDVRTVQGEIASALRSLGWWSEGCLELSSRTDAGVSVRMNLATISVPQNVRQSVGEAAFVSALNDHLPSDLVVWRARWVPAETHCRHAVSRTYVYRCEMMKNWPQDFDLELFTAACSAFVGTHDFSNFCRLDGERSPIRSIDICEPWIDESGRVVGFRVTGEAFLWNQIRRIGSAIRLVMVGEISVGDIRAALDNPQSTIDYGRASADGLVLWSLNHSDFDGPEESAPTDVRFSRAPAGERSLRQWMSLAKLENASLLEREWLSLIEDAA